MDLCFCSGVGVVMVIGGYRSGPTRDVEFVDVSEAKNVSLSLPALLPDRKAGVAANLVNDAVIACGGHETATCYTYRYEA